MQTDRFTTKAQGALQDAQRIAQEQSHQAIDGEHLFLALLRQSEGLIQPLLQKLGVQLARIEQEVEAELGRRAKVQGGTETYLTPEMRKALEAAEKEAHKLKDEYTSTEHLLLGLIDAGGTALKRIFSTHQVSRNEVLRALAELRGNQRVTDQNPEDKFQALEKYGRDLTA